MIVHASENPDGSNPEMWTFSPFASKIMSIDLAF